MVKIESTAPDTARIICLKSGDSVPPKVVSIVVSRVSIDTLAAISVIVFAAEYTGLLYFLYRTMFTIANVNVTNVYAARVIVVIS